MNILRLALQEIEMKKDIFFLVFSVIVFFAVFYLQKLNLFEDGSFYLELFSVILFGSIVSISVFLINVISKISSKIKSK